METIWILQLHLQSLDVFLVLEWFLKFCLESPSKHNGYSETDRKYMVRALAPSNRKGFI